MFKTKNVQGTYWTQGMPFLLILGSALLIAAWLISTQPINLIYKEASAEKSSSVPDGEFGAAWIYRLDRGFDVGTVVFVMRQQPVQEKSTFPSVSEGKVWTEAPKQTGTENIALPVPEVWADVDRALLLADKLEQVLTRRIEVLSGEVEMLRRLAEASLLPPPPLPVITPPPAPVPHQEAQAELPSFPAEVTKKETGSGSAVDSDKALLSSSTFLFDQVTTGLADVPSTDEYLVLTGERGNSVTGSAQLTDGFANKEMLFRGDSVSQFTLTLSGNGYTELGQKAMLELKDLYGNPRPTAQGVAFDVENAIFALAFDDTSIVLTYGPKLADNRGVADRSDDAN